MELQVSLIVFDETHHAGPKKKHPYSEVLRQHYHPRKQSGLFVPRILGLTASPIWNVKNPSKAISDLEALLDAKIFEVSKHHEKEMSSHSPKAAERLVEHDPEVPEEDVELAAMVSRLGTEVMLEEKWVDRIDAAQKVRPVFLLSPSEHAADRSSLQLFGSSGAIHLIAQLASERQASPTFLSEVAAITSSLLRLDSLSNKVKALVDIFGDSRSLADDHFHAIIFVEQRAHALILAALLPRIPQLAVWIRSAALVGHGGRGIDGDGKDIGMEVREQVATVAKFRGGQVLRLFSFRCLSSTLTTTLHSSTSSSPRELPRKVSTSDNATSSSASTPSRR